MKKKLPPSAPFIGAGIAWAAYALSVPFYTVSKIIGAAVIAVITYVIVKKFTAKPEKPPEIKQEPAEKRVQEQAALLDTQAAQLLSVSVGIKEPAVASYASSIAGTMKKMADNIEANPADSKQIRSFTKHYVPTVIKVFTTYSNYEKQDNKGLNVCETMWKIEDSLKNIDSAFRKQLDDLFEDDALDIMTDLQVLDQMMSPSGTNKMNFDDLTK